MMLIDLHAHYPMHLSGPGDASAPHPGGVGEKVRGWLERRLLKFLNDNDNFPAPETPAVTIPNLKKGNVAVALSLLYMPFDEMDLSKQYASPPDASYFDDLRAQKDAVEKDIQGIPGAVIAHNHSELKDNLGKNVVLIHAVEGGFVLGNNIKSIQENVAALASWGVAYVTVAHLFFRQIATNAPAIPFVADWLYKLLFPQSGTLTDLGKAAIQAMVAHHILIDLTHMSEASITATLNLLDQIDPGKTVPVSATHCAYRFGTAEYNLTADHIQRIKLRNGVVGLIACDHWMTDGIRGKTTSPDESMKVFKQHIDKIYDLTGSYDHVAIGSDLDGFIKPSMAGFEFPNGFNAFYDFLTKNYDQAIADQIFSGNALRLLGYWRGA
jgi:microsomal dipeptidase-like Zn-dependent dipeptidase